MGFFFLPNFDDVTLLKWMTHQTFMDGGNAVDATANTALCRRKPYLNLGFPKATKKHINSNQQKL
jgi:hypothetical protein